MDGTWWFYATFIGNIRKIREAYNCGFMDDFQTPIWKIDRRTDYWSIGLYENCVVPTSPNFMLDTNMATTIRATSIIIVNDMIPMNV